MAPFYIISASGTNAFCLEFPRTMKIIPVFNISLLRPFPGTYKPSGPTYIDDKAEYEIECILCC